MKVSATSVRSSFFGDRVLGIRVVCPQSGAAAL